jgi:hypothetical protein
MMKHIPLFFFLLVLPVAAQIDSGGGQTAVGSGTNYSSIGSPFATGQRVISTGKNLTGRIEVLYASGPVDPDTDGDGMPDDWERTHGLVVGIDDSELDLDGDGVTNINEYIAGTDPLDGDSFFEIILLTRAAVTKLVTVTWSSNPGRSYTLQKSVDLSPGSWDNIATGIIATGATTSLLDPSADDQSRMFYRVGVE